MKVTQIATALNNVLNKLQIGAVAVDGVTSAAASVADDLSNIVDVGKKITAFTGADQNNFETFMKNLIDQVGKIQYVDRTYDSQAPDIMVDSWDYGSILMKVRCELPDARDNDSWKLGDMAGSSPATYPNPFELTPPEVEAKFYNTKTTYEVPITLCQVQLEEAVRSASELQRLIAMIENRVQVKRTLCNDALVMETITNLMAGVINENSGNRVVDLLAGYNAGPNAGGTPLTAAKALSTPEFLKYATSTMMKYKKYLAKASTRYNSGDYVTFTPADRLKFVAVADFAKDVETYLYSGTYHDEFVRMEGYQEVADWGCSGTDADRFKLFKYLGAGVDGEPISPTLVKADCVLGIMFDEWAAVCANRNDRVTSIYNPRGEYTNFFYKWDAAYLNDWFENAVIFTIGGATLNSIPGTIAAGTSNGTTKYTFTAKTGATYYVNNNATAATVEVGKAYVASGNDKYPTGTWSSYTSGANISSATTSKTVTIIEVIGGIITGVVAFVPTSSQIGS